MSSATSNKKRKREEESKMLARFLIPRSVVRRNPTLVSVSTPSVVPVLVSVSKPLVVPLSTPSQEWDHLKKDEYTLYFNSSVCDHINESGVECHFHINDNHTDWTKLHVTYREGSRQSYMERPQPNAKAYHYYGFSETLGYEVSADKLGWDTKCWDTIPEFEGVADMMVRLFWEYVRKNKSDIETKVRASYKTYHLATIEECIRRCDVLYGRVKDD
jgi:hypothetical protein